MIKKKTFFEIIFSYAATIDLNQFTIDNLGKFIIHNSKFTIDNFLKFIIHNSKFIIVFEEGISSGCIRDAFGMRSGFAMQDFRETKSMILILQNRR